MSSEPMKMNARKALELRSAVTLAAIRVRLFKAAAGTRGAE